ncbi:MAG: FIST C-terminal domain-containing protein [Candidatus Omnitrophica bacterium]|nr:FIST C-terminal domain-containing protein [Candidatus Omnitrophota bacterium]
MGTQVGIGVSTKLDSTLAGREAAREAYSHLREHPDVIFVFISPIFEQEEAIKGIRSVIKGCLLVGCSSVGSITSGGCFLGAVAVCAIASTDISFSSSASLNVSRNARLAGNKAAKESICAKNSDRQLYIMFTDCLSGNMADVLRGAQEILGTRFPIIGGSAVDNFQFRKTWQYLNNDILSDSVVGLFIGGNINVGIGVSHGWQPVGSPHRITRSSSNILKEIDRRPAIELYNEYLGKDPGELLKEGIGKLGCNYPLGIRIKDKDTYMTRSPIRIEDNGALVLSAEIPEHKNINLMIGDNNLALEATREACREALKNSMGKNISFAIVFSDIARLQLLRKDQHKEVEIIRKALGKDVPFFGCYTCGEYAPVDLYGYSGQSYFHNQAISIALFSN